MNNTCCCGGKYPNLQVHTPKECYTKFRDYASPDTAYLDARTPEERANEPQTISTTFTSPDTEKGWEETARLKARDLWRHRSWNDEDEGYGEIDAENMLVDFITSLLLQAKQEAREEILAALPKEKLLRGNIGRKSASAHNANVMAHNTVLKEIREIIRTLKSQQEEM